MPAVVGEVWWRTPENLRDKLLPNTDFNLHLLTLVHLD